MIIFLVNIREFLVNILCFHLYWYFLSGKLEELACMAQFSPTSSSWVICQCLKYFRAILRHIMTFSGWKNSKPSAKPSTFLYTPRAFQRCKNHLNRSSYEEVMPPASWPTYLTTMVPCGCHVSPKFSHVLG